MNQNASAPESNSGEQPVPKKFFVSYSWEDSEVADAFCLALKERGIPYWIDREEIEPGAIWPGALTDAIDESAGLILLLSKSSDGSPRVWQEVERAVGGKKAFFPVRIDGVEPSRQLALYVSNVQIADLPPPFQPARLNQLAIALAKAQPSGTKGPTKNQEQLQSMSALRRALSFAKRHTLAMKLLAFLLACLSTQIIDFEVEEENDDLFVAAQLQFGLVTHYREIAAKAKAPKKTHTVLIEINSATTPGIKGDDCKEIRYLGELLKTLAYAGPKVVVIDKAFAKDKCGNELPNLVKGVASLCNIQANVVVGRWVDSKDQDQNRKPYRLLEAYSFRPQTSCVTEALMDLHPDFRRVQLTFPDTEPSTQSQTQDKWPRSFALAAAQLLEPARDFSRYAGDAPYSSVLGPEQIERKLAQDVVCGSLEEYRACDKLHQRSDMERIKDNVVIIGDRFDRVDEHETLFGLIHGCVIQASHIEAVLGDRLFPRVSKWFDWVVGLAMFLGFEYLLSWSKGIRAVGMTLAVLIGLLVSEFLAMSSFGYYFNPIPLLVLAALYSQILRVIAR